MASQGLSDAARKLARRWLGDELALSMQWQGKRLRELHEAAKDGVVRTRCGNRVLAALGKRSVRFVSGHE